MKIVNVVDLIFPVTTFVNNCVPDQIPPNIKNKINKTIKTDTFLYQQDL